MRTVSVVAPTYNRCAGLEAFVEPLLREPALTELVMAVDGSPDDSVEWLRERARDDERLVVLDLPNGGAGWARQRGLEAATGEVVLLLDDDVIITPGVVAGHAQHHEDLAPRLVLGYMPNDWRTVPPEDRAIAWIYRRAYESHVAAWLDDPGSILHGLWGGNLSMPREAMLMVGIQKLDVKRGQDDREFGIRCLKAGVEGVFDPRLRAEHLYHRPMAAFRRDMRIQGESRLLLHDAHEDLLGADLVEHPTGSCIADGVGLGLPPLLRPLWRLLARDPVFGPATRTAQRVHDAAARLGAFRLQVLTAQGIGSLEVVRGVDDTAAQARTPRAAAAASEGEVAATASRFTRTDAATSAQTSKAPASTSGAST